MLILVVFNNKSTISDTLRVAHSSLVGFFFFFYRIFLSTSQYILSQTFLSIPLQFVFQGLLEYCQSAAASACFLLRVAHGEPEAPWPFAGHDRRAPRSSLPLPSSSLWLGLSRVNGKKLKQTPWLRFLKRPGFLLLDRSWVSSWSHESHIAWVREPSNTHSVKQREGRGLLCNMAID